MHWIMSFVGAVGTPLKNSGLLPWLMNAFGGAEKMLLIKKFLMNVTALCFTISELLRDHINPLACFDDPIKFFDKCSAGSMSSKHWIDNLIRSVFLILLYIPAERESNLPLRPLQQNDAIFFLCWPY